MRERDRDRERERENLKQTSRWDPNADLGPTTRETVTQTEIKSRMLNRLSHPGTPRKCFSYIWCGSSGLPPSWGAPRLEACLVAPGERRVSFTQVVSAAKDGRTAG